MKDIKRIIFVSCNEELDGIPDDYFLLTKLHHRSISYEYIPWTDVSNLGELEQGCVIIIRSLWEGRTRKGTCDELLRFFSQCASRCPNLAFDYHLLDWTAHKSYLLELAAANVDIVPTCIVPTSSYISEFFPGADVIESSPGGIKREMVKRNWLNAILKPAVGTRCEGVMRLSISSWTLQVAFAVASLLKGGDCLLQPFLPPVFSTISNENAHDESLIKSCTPLGEVCVLCIDGEITHAVHKNPALWGWHESTCACSGSLVDLEASTCTCSLSLCEIDRITPSNLSVSPATGVTDANSPLRVSKLLMRAPVETVLLPLPDQCIESINLILRVLQHKR